MRSPDNDIRFSRELQKSFGARSSLEEETFVQNTFPMKLKG